MKLLITGNEEYNNKEDTQFSIDLFIVQNNKSKDKITILTTNNNEIDKIIQEYANSKNYKNEQYTKESVITHALIFTTQHTQNIKNIEQEIRSKNVIPEIHIIAEKYDDKKPIKLL